MQPATSAPTQTHPAATARLQPPIAQHANVQQSSASSDPPLLHSLGQRRPVQSLPATAPSRGTPVEAADAKGGGSRDLSSPHPGHVSALSTPNIPASKLEPAATATIAAAAHTLVLLSSLTQRYRAPRSSTAPSATLQESGAILVQHEAAEGEAGAAVEADVHAGRSPAAVLQNAPQLLNPPAMHPASRHPAARHALAPPPAELPAFNEAQMPDEDTNLLFYSLSHFLPRSRATFELQTEVTMQVLSWSDDRRRQFLLSAYHFARVAYASNDIPSMLEIMDDIVQGRV